MRALRRFSHVRTADVTGHALTGNYEAEVNVGGATFKEILRVESIRPNCFKIELAVDAQPDGPKGTVAADLQAAWLHGVPQPTANE